jgi:hypothetical protein
VEWTDTLKILTNISNLLVVTNSSINIVIYAMKDFKFRQVRAGTLIYHVCTEEGPKVLE